MSRRVVLVTGVSRHLGGRLARLLAAEPSVAAVVGVDVEPPAGDLGDARFVRADIRHPVIARVIAEHAVDTVVHMNVIATPVGAGGRPAMKEINVIGTMQLLAACQKAARVRKLVVKSTTAVYGASPRDPAVFTEETEPAAPPAAGYAKDAIEVEGYVRGFARRRPDVAVTQLRFANFVGPTITTPLTGYFALPVVPTVLGFDPRLQFVHEDDGVEVLRRAVVDDHPGTLNVAGSGTLLLSQALRRAGRVAVPVPSPSVGLLGQLARRAHRADFSPEQLRFLQYGRVVDTTRLVEEFGYRPRFTTPEAYDDFVRARLHPLYTREQVAGLERAVAEQLVGAGRG